MLSSIIHARMHVNRHTCMEHVRSTYIYNLITSACPLVWPAWKLAFWDILVHILVSVWQLIGCELTSTLIGDR